MRLTNLIMNAKPKVLVVEDDHALREALLEKLSREECEVHAAVNGQEGLDIALREHPDLILLDIVMPVMDGVSMLRALREDNWGKNAPVVMLTNLNENDKVAQTLELGSYEYFVKSDHSIADIVTSIKEKLHRVE